LNRWFNACVVDGFYRSLSQYLKHKVKNAVNYISDFESALANAARRRGVDGVVCGHIHKAEIRSIDGILYCNDGDWVESLTALVESEDGTLSILHWKEIAEAAAATARSSVRDDEEASIAYSVSH
jgi:UDP-2,3-diacylglucosamine pyrophosphatase LpxH